jgi:hypothetical protein
MRCSGGRRLVVAMTTRGGERRVDSAATRKEITVRRRSDVTTAHVRGCTGIAVLQAVAGSPEDGQTVLHAPSMRSV